MAARAATKPVSRFIGNKYRVDTKSDSGLQIDEALERFKESRRSGTGNSKGAARDRTILEYDYDIKKFMAFLKEHKVEFWNDFEQDMVENFVERVQARDIKQVSKNKVYRSLRAFLRFVSVDGMCRNMGMNPHLDAIPVIRKQEGRVWIPTPAVLHKFHESFNTNLSYDFRDYVIVAAMLDCGARNGEICAMKPDHLKLDTAQLIIPEEGKTRTRIVPLDSEMTVPLLKRYMATRNEESKWLFPNKYGGFMTPNTLDQSFARKRKLLGIEDSLTPHTLRHYFATHYLVNGGSLQNLKHILGHSNYETLNIYVHMANQLTTIKEEHQRVSPLKSLKRDSGTVEVKKKRRTV